MASMAFGRRSGAVPAAGKFARIECRQGRLVQFGRLHVQGDVDPDGSGPAVFGQVDCLVEMVSNRLGIVDQHGVLGDRLNDVDNVDFLKAHLTNAAARQQIGPFHLAREDQRGDRIEPGADHSGDGVRAAGSGRHQGDAEIAGVLRVGVRGDGTGLFVQIADEPEVLFTPERIDQVHAAAAGQQEDVPYAGFGHAAHHIIG